MKFRNPDEAIGACQRLRVWSYVIDLYPESDVAMRRNELNWGETYVNRENFEAMQGFHAGWRKSGIGGADGRHDLRSSSRLT